MKNKLYLLGVIILIIVLTACSKSDVSVLPENNEGSLTQTDKEIPNTEKSKIKSIPFLKNQLYAVAFLGFEEMNDLSFYVENYLDSENIPIHYLSKGEFYLIIPRYSNMDIKLYKNDFETMGSTLIFEEKNCRPFIIQCNISDIFPDSTISFTYNNETVEFTPYISLKDGDVVVGDRGLNITKPN